MLSKAAIKKMVPAENIGAIVKFLCSDAAASITGIALPIDGGWTLLNVRTAVLTGTYS